MSWTNPQFLVETDWLAAHVDDPSLRVLECTTILHPRPEGGYRAESGRGTWAGGHIPRSGFADLTDDLCDRTPPLNYMMPPAEQMAASMARLGVGEGTRVVLYDRSLNMWAARVWWMLRAVGFGDAAVPERRLAEVDGRGSPDLHGAVHVPAGPLRRATATRPVRGQQRGARRPRGARDLHSQRTLGGAA
jgi:thiosulfate/3-mercaptopyruvate sulfurtransferase